MPKPQSYEKSHFLVYSNGAEPFAANADAYCDSALSVGFDTATHYTEKMLRQTPFWAENEAILTQERGAGYWLWKPYIVLETLRKVGPNDIVIYNDAGRYKPGSFEPFPSFPHTAAELTARSPKRFLHGFINDWLVTGRYTKRDCLILMGADYERFHHAPQISACPLLYMQSPESFDFLERWLAFAKDPRILTDLPDELDKPHRFFEDHRHDMAIASLLAHQTGAAYFDLSKEGGFQPAEEVRRRYQHVLRIQTHIGYLSLMAERALGDDFLLHEGANLDDAKVIVRNLTPDQPIPVRTLGIPVTKLRSEITDMLGAGKLTLSQDHVRAVLIQNQVISSKLHALSQSENAEVFWQSLLDETCLAARDLGPESTKKDIAHVAFEGFQAAKQRYPEMDREMNAMYVWACLQQDARAPFKERFKNVKARQGRAGLEAFLDSGGVENVLSLEQERSGAHNAVSKEINKAMLQWLEADKSPEE